MIADAVIAVVLVTGLLAFGHLMTCPAHLQRTVAFLDAVVERIKFGRREP